MVWKVAWENDSLKAGDILYENVVVKWVSIYVLNTSFKWIMNGSCSCVSLTYTLYVDIGE